MIKSKRYYYTKKECRRGREKNLDYEIELFKKNKIIED